jgi:Transglutaminase-like superfamily
VSALGDGGSFLGQVKLGARAVGTRLRLVSMVRRRALPDLLVALTPSSEDRVEPAPLAAVEQAVAASERFVERLRVVPDTCLYRSLARYAMLRRAGHPVRFVMGLDARRCAHEIVGHAWVELHGSPLGEELDPGLSVTFTYPRSTGS